MDLIFRVFDVAIRWIGAKWPFDLKTERIFLLVSVAYHSLMIFFISREMAVQSGYFSVVLYSNIRLSVIHVYLLSDRMEVKINNKFIISISERMLEFLKTLKKQYAEVESIRSYNEIDKIKK